MSRPKGSVSRVRNSDHRNYQDVGAPAQCSEAQEHRTHLEKATAAWHVAMKREGHKPHVGKCAPSDGVPKRIAPAIVPMGGSSMGNV